MVDKNKIDNIELIKEAVPVTPKSSWIWINDSAGHPSVTVTFAFFAFWVTTIAYVLSFFTRIGPLEIRAFDIGATSAYMIPIMSLYFGRRLTDAKWGNPNIPQTDTPKE